MPTELPVRLTNCPCTIRKRFLLTNRDKRLTPVVGCYVLSTSALFELRNLDVGSWPFLAAGWLKLSDCFSTCSDEGRFIGKRPEGIIH